MTSTNVIQPRPFQPQAKAYDCLIKGEAKPEGEVIAVIAKSSCEAVILASFKYAAIHNGEIPFTGEAKCLC